MKLIPFKDLRSAKGITLSYSQAKRLSRAGKFPKPIRLNGGDRGVLAYVNEELDQYIEQRMAERGRKRDRA